MGRLSWRNKQTIYYALLTEQSEIEDEYENKTGQFKLTYSAPVKVNWNVCFLDSKIEIEMFGLQSKDMIRIVAEKNNFPLNESSIIWYGKEPEKPYDPEKPKHNYVISGMRPSLNELIFYARKVTVS